MWEEVNQALGRALGQMGVDLAALVPSLGVALVLMLVSFVVAALTRMLLARGLAGLEFDRWADRLEIHALVGLPASTSPSHAVARLTSWVILIVGLLVSLTALNAAIPSRLALSVVEYVPHLLAALFILVVGALAARFMARSVLIGAVNQQIQSARLLSLAVKWLVLLVAGAMALDHLGIGRSILLLAFGILFGGVVLAAALAVGLGARDLVGRMLEHQLHETARTAGDRIDHV